MRLRFAPFALGLLSIPIILHARDKVVYGDDNRLDLYDVKGRFYEFAQSTAAMIFKEKMTLENKVFSINGKPLSSKNVCQDERFASQKTAADCTGFLVAPDIIVTAGHCVTTESMCKNYSWVFGFSLRNEGDEAYNEIDQEEVYNCKKIHDFKLDTWTKEDFGIVILDREVTGRKPLSIRKTGKIGNNIPLVVIGHPSGLPSKVAAGATVRTNDNPVFFVANLDSFGGNSGSPVFNESTGQVEGILVQGEDDYEYAPNRDCRVVKKCTDAGCRGEHVTRISDIEELRDILKTRGL